MPRVFSQKAQKDYPAQGIKKGETYYKWKIKTGPVSGRLFRSKTYPKPSQLTMSAFKIALYEIEETLSEIEIGGEGSVEDQIESAKSEIEEVIQRAEELREETQEKFDNTPESLQQASTGELLQERADALESYISELESVKDSAPERDDDESDEDYKTRAEEWLDSEVKAVSPGV